MDTVTLADAKARLSELVERAIQGEPVRITRRGKPVVQITALPQEKPPLDVEALRRHLGTMTSPVMDTEESIRLWRDDSRY